LELAKTFIFNYAIDVFLVLIVFVCLNLCATLVSAKPCLRQSLGSKRIKETKKKNKGNGKG